MTQDGSKVAPRSRQDGPKDCQEAVKIPACSDLQKTPGCQGSKYNPRQPNVTTGGPKMAQDVPNMTQDGSKVVPRRLQDGPKDGQAGMLSSESRVGFNEFHSI